MLHTNPIMGLLNDYLGDCVQRFPDRLIGLASIKEWDIDSDPEGQGLEVERAYANGLAGLQFVVNARFRNGVHASWDGPECRTFWDGVAALGRPILFTIVPHGPRPNPEGYLEALRTWRGWLERYPEVPAVLTHGFPWRMFMEGDRIALPDAIFEPFRASGASLQLLYHISLGNVWDYPYPQLHSTTEQLVRVLGSERLMWGTDMPNVERFCNYRQTLDTFRVHHRGVIDDRDIDNITGETARRLFVGEEVP